MSETRQDLLRRLPSVESVLQQLAGEHGPRTVLLDAVRRAIEDAREAVLSEGGDGLDEASIRERVIEDARGRLRIALARHYRRAINATGIILHTGLGRAPLATAALRHIDEELTGYSVLQSGVETGQRAKRDGRIEQLLTQLTGAAAATVVNNNAAATAIVLNTVARGREVIVSRGQLVEIGGAFRLPDVMESSGVRLVEVGATNKTHLRDYENAVTEETAAIMRVHPSNYKIVGFSSEVPLDELVGLAHDRGLVMIDDVGAGALLDLSRYWGQREPTLPESVAAGADVITASADKLIGASQGGIILGREDLVAAVRKNPLARIVRVDKITLAALEATLSLFLDEATAMEEIPALRMMKTPLSQIADAAERIAAAIGKSARVNVEVVDGASQMGSGSLPGQNLPTRLVAVRPEGVGVDEFALRLRRNTPAVYTRIQREQILIDPRTLLAGEEEALVRAFADALADGA